MERSGRFVMPLHLPEGHTGEQVLAAIQESLPSLPAQLRRSLTWDQGAKMVGIHDRVRISTRVDVYVCDPRSPWRRNPADIRLRLPGHLLMGRDCSQIELGAGGQVSYDTVREPVA